MAGYKTIAPASRRESVRAASQIGLFFDEKCWDGTDVFTAEGSTLVFMTRRVKDALEAVKISNAS